MRSSRAGYTAVGVPGRTPMHQKSPACGTVAPSTVIITWTPVPIRSIGVPTLWPVSCSSQTRRYSCGVWFGSLYSGGMDAGQCTVLVSGS